MPTLRHRTFWFVVVLLFSVLNCFADSTNEPAWWSLKPIERPAVPIANISAATSNPIDAFIATELRKKDLGPSHEADRRTLLRRLYFGLTGLPPSSEEVIA